MRLAYWGPMMKYTYRARRRSTAPSCWATHPATMIVTCSPSRLRLARGPMYDSMQRNL